MLQTWHALITGSPVDWREFGVWVASLARRHGLAGWAREANGGALDLVLQGEQTSVTRAIAQLRVARGIGKVERLTVRAVGNTRIEGFKVLSVQDQVVTETSASTMALARDTRSASRTTQDGASTKADTVAALIERAAHLDQDVRREISRYFTPAQLKQTSGSELDTVRQALGDATPFQISYMTLRRLERAQATVGRGLSFHAKMVEASEARLQSRQKAVRRLDDKARAYAFIDRLGVLRPGGSTTPVAIHAIEPTFPSVVKNTRGTGSRGCYLVFNHDHIVHVYDRIQLSSWSAMVSHAQSLMDPTGQGRTLRDNWLVEELIFDPDDHGRAAADVKFYTFYGDVEIVLEMRRDQGREYSFARGDNTPIDSGIDVKTYRGDGVTGEELDLVRKISLAIPYPFLRIDMLRGSRGLVFGEFTPRTGNFDEFRPAVDRMLGEAWAAAESRLWIDLIRGKSFDAFREAVQI